MKKIGAALVILAAFASLAVAQAKEQTITIKQAVSNNQADPSGAKEISLLDQFSSSCNGKAACSFDGPQLVPSGQFMIAVIYECRDDARASRQIGPKQFNGTQRFDLNCQ